MTNSEQSAAGESSQSRARANASSVCGAFANAFEELGRAMSPPENVRRHFQEAHKQMLMGLRELIDNQIQKLSRDEAKGTRVTVE